MGNIVGILHSCWPILLLAYLLVHFACRKPQGEMSSRVFIFDTKLYTRDCVPRLEDGQH
jgi:hypothetical protein